MIEQMTDQPVVVSGLNKPSGSHTKFTAEREEPGLH